MRESGWRGIFIQEDVVLIVFLLHRNQPTINTAIKGGERGGRSVLLLFVSDSGKRRREG